MASKSDLLKLLKGLIFKEPPEVKDARNALTEARKAREDFERSNKTWRRLKRAERIAEQDLIESRDINYKTWKREILACRQQLLLYGVTPEILNRIERMVNGDGSE